MRRTFAIIFLLLANLSFSQDDAADIKVYDWVDVVSENPDTIFGISFQKTKLEAVPEELKKFKYLRVLNLGKNKLEKLPDFIGEFQYLETLNVEKNNLSYFPIHVCRMKGLKELILNRNDIDQIPTCIQYAESLEYLDLYDNPIRALPEEITKLENLAKIDLSGIRFSPSFQRSWIQKMPHVKFEFDAPCDCME